MLNSATMTAEQEKEARAQAFYLLKKYTSYTFLDKARSLYQGLLDAYVQQITLLEQKRKKTFTERLFGEPDYYLQGQIQGCKALLSHMIPIEEGLKLLRTTPHKLEAYRQFGDCTAPISDYFFGRNAHENLYGEDPFFQALGMVPEDSTEPLTGVIKDFTEMRRMMFRLKATLFSRWTGYRTDPQNYKSFVEVTAYNYHSMLGHEFYDSDPLFTYIYPFHFPSPLPECPPSNTNAAGEVWSGKTIPTHGIWEPWLLNGKVGCPNYFLAGQTAIEYQLEGTQDKEAVRWRLLWEDKRYLDGTIPSEEALYFAKPEPVATRQTVLSAQPGQAVPRAGVWQTPAMLENRTLTLAAGEMLPYAQTDKAGNAVVWFWKAE